MGVAGVEGGEKDVGHLSRSLRAGNDILFNGFKPSKGMFMTRVATLIGPADNGRRMSLAEFDHADGVPGYHYELSRGVITVTDVPSVPHALQMEALRDQFILYRIQKQISILHVLSGA